MSHNNKLVSTSAIESRSQSQPCQEGSTLSESKEKLPIISLQGKIKLNPKSFDNDVTQLGVFEFKTLCSKHVDEQVCFYSFTHKQALCSECLLSGAYNGCDVLSMKKAADRLKPDYEKLLEEISIKMKESNVYRDELVNKKKEFQTLALDYQREAYKKINILRELVNQKERGLMENLESIKMAKQIHIETFYQNIKKSQNNLSNVQKIVQSKLNNMNEIEVCEFYHCRTGIVRDFLESHSTDSHELRFIAQHDDFKDLENFNKEMDQIIKSLGKFNDMKESKPIVVRKIEDMKRADFQNMISRSFGMENKEEEETVFETEADDIEILPVPKFVTEPEEDHRQFIDRANSSPFQALRRDLEPISPMKCAANDELSVTDDTLKFFLKVEDYKKTTQFECLKKELFDQQQEEGLANSTKKFKDLNFSNIDQQPTFRKRGYTGGLLSNNKSPGTGESLTSKRTNLKTFNLSQNKHIPRSFLPGSLSVNTQPDLLTPFTMSSQRLLSPASLKSPSQIGVSKLSNNKTAVGSTGESQKLRFKSEEKTPPTIEGSNFAKNIRRLQKQLDINAKIQELKDKVPAVPVTRGQLDKVFTGVLLINSVVAAVSVVLFLISSWSFFLASGAFTIPLLIITALLYRYTFLKGPIKRYVINTCVKVYNGFVQKREGLLRRIYLAICWFLPTEEWKHINWGYASLTRNGHSISNLNYEDEDKRTYYQLYHYLATGFGNWNTLEGKTVLELRSGGGGGINYVAQKLNPDKCIGVDISSTQSKFCQKAYSKIPKLSFYTADTLDAASRIPELVDQRIDMIISAQSSKYVKDFKLFIEEVEKILKPGGVFAFADLRLTEDWAQLESDLASTSLKIIQREDISKNVMHALKIDEKGKWQVVSGYLGSFARMIFKALGIVKNNVISEALKKGGDSARSYLLLKPSHESDQ